MHPPSEFVPEDWEADDISFTCHHGNRFEHDGAGPCGCESPLVSAGVI